MSECNRRGVAGLRAHMRGLAGKQRWYRRFWLMLTVVGLLAMPGLGISSAFAQPIHEEAEPNDTPALAPVLAGPIRILGTVGAAGNDDEQDAFVWQVSEADARRRWTITLDGNEAPRTHFLLMRLSYEDAARTRVLKRETILTRSVAAGQRPLTLPDVLVPAGEYLIGIGTAGSPPSGTGPVANSPLGGLGKNLQAAAADNEQQGKQAAVTQTPAQEAALANARYELVLAASEEAYTNDPLANTAKRPLSFSDPRGRDLLSIDRSIWGEFRIGRNNDGQRWDVSGALDLGKAATVRLVNSDNATLTQAKIAAGEGGQFRLPSLVLAPGQYRVAIDLAKDSPQPSHALFRLASVGEVVEGEEAEPNGSAEQANQLTLGKALRARADERGDADYFRFDLKPGQLHQTLDLVGSFDQADTNAHICLHTAGVKPIRLQCRQRGTQAGDVELSSLVLPAGAYTLDVAGVRPDARYTIHSAFGPLPRAGAEVEPNDIADFASDMGRRKVISGTLVGEDVDVIAFEVTDPESQYRLQTKGVGQMTLTDDAGRLLLSMNARDEDGIMRAESLDLLPGRYQLTLSHGRQEKYRVLVRNLGQLPDDFEREPNDNLAGAGRLREGKPLRGILPDGDRVDMLVFRLDGRDWRRLKVQVPDDARMRVGLKHQGTSIGALDILAGETVSFDRQFEAGFYTISLNSQSGPSLGHYAISLEAIDPPAAASVEQEPNNLPEDANLVAAGGRMQGLASDLGGDDYFTTPRPAGEGFLVHVCQSSSRTMVSSSFSAGPTGKPDRPVNGRAGVQAFAFGADDGPDWLVRYRDGDYNCRLYAEPQTMSVPANEASTLITQAIASNGTTSAAGNDSAGALTDNAELMAASELPVRDELRLRGALYSSRHTVRLPFDAPAGTAVRVGCALEEPAENVSLSVRMEQRDRGQPMDPASTLYRTDPEGKADALLINATQPDWARPVPFVCDVQLQAVMRPWPAAEAPSSWVGTAPTLPVSVVAGYLPGGQRLEGSLAVTNDGSEPVDLDLRGRVTGRGWRVADLPSELTVAAGQTRRVDFTVLVAPFASTLTSPRVLIEMDDGRVSRTVASAPVQVSHSPADAAEAVRVRHTPDELARWSGPPGKRWWAPGR